MSLATFQVRESPSGPVRTLIVPDPAVLPLSIRRMLRDTTTIDAPILLNGLGVTPLQKNVGTPFVLEFTNPRPDLLYSGRVDCQMNLQVGPLGYANPISTAVLALECSIDGAPFVGPVAQGQQQLFAVGVPLTSVDGGSCLVSLSLRQILGALLGVLPGTTSLRLRAVAAMALAGSPPIEVNSDSGGFPGGTLALEFVEQNP